LRLVYKKSRQRIFILAAFDCFIGFLSFINEVKKNIHWLVWGFLYGVVVNFHLISVVTIFSLILIYITANIKRKNLIKNVLSVVIGFTILIYAAFDF